MPASTAWWTRRDIPSALREALELVRPAGFITKVGWGPQPMDFSLDPLVQKAVRLQGSFSHNWPVWERVIALLASGALDVAPLVGGVWPLARVARGVRAHGARRDRQGSAASREGVMTMSSVTTQVSLDLTTIAEALDLARGARRAGVDWLEAGTPLILGEGLHAVRALREEFPGSPSWPTSRPWTGRGSRRR